MARLSARAEEREAAEGPAWNENLVGHEEAENTFLQAMVRGRMPHAWMISGIKGVGKATLAYRMARTLLAPDAAASSPTDDFFGVPPSVPGSLHMPPSDPVFRRIAQQAHPDFRVLERTVNPKSGKLRSEILVEDVRAIIEFLRLKPALGGWRVVIVDSADELNRNAANALLKILEEPPSRSVLILVANAPKALLPTLVSRCRKLALRPLSQSVISATLTDRFPDLGRDEVDLMAVLSEGSLGRAIHIAEGDGAILFAEIADLLGAWPDQKVQELHDLADRMVGRAGESVFELAREMLAWWFARFMRQAARRTPPERDLFPGEAALIQRMSSTVSLARWMQSWERANLIFNRVASVNMDRKQAWIGAMLVLSGEAC